MNPLESWMPRPERRADSPSECLGKIRPSILFITHDLEEAIFLGTRVVVMTTRPGRIKKMIEVDIPRPRDYRVLSSERYRELKSEAIDGAVHELGAYASLKMTASWARVSRNGVVCGRWPLNDTKSARNVSTVTSTTALGTRLSGPPFTAALGGRTVVGRERNAARRSATSFSFGVPVRITARIYAGRRGVINIDREVSLSGAIHDKGALILIGYLGGRYAQEQTLSLSASITFEQSYDEIDGDSASCAELCALLSALSGLPVKQCLAMTGSVDQQGNVQAIGAVNQKIEASLQSAVFAASMASMV
jgi:hypothetical protein